MTGLKERPVSTLSAGFCWILVFLHILSCADGSPSFPPLDRQAETALLTRVEAKHEAFPTYVYGRSRSGSPVIYKPKLSGIRDFRNFFVLQTDSYMIDLLLQATNEASFTLVLDFAAISKRLRAPTLEMWDSLRTVVDPLPPSAKVSIEHMVTRVFQNCEAVVVVNATALVKLLRPVISLMVPVSSEKLFVSTDLSALFKVVPPNQVPRPYSPSSADTVSVNPQTTHLYELLNSRAQELLGRPLAIDLAGESSGLKKEITTEISVVSASAPSPAAPPAAKAAKTAAAGAEAKAAEAEAAAELETETTGTDREDADGDDMFDDID